MEDIEIARKVKLEEITKVAKDLGIKYRALRKI